MLQELREERNDKKPESIEFFMKDKAFSPSEDLTPPHPLPHLPSVSSNERQHTGRLRKRDKLLTGERAKSHDGKKA